MWPCNCPCKSGDSATPNFRKQPPLLEDALFMQVLLGPRLERCLEIRKDWPIPPTTNTGTITTTNPKLPTIKVEPQDPDQSNPNSTVTKPEMQIGTKLSHLQKCIRELGWRTSETTSTIWYTAEVPFPRLRYKASPGTKPTVHQKLSGTTKPAHPNYTHFYTYYYIILILTYINTYNIIILFFIL